MRLRRILGLRDRGYAVSYAGHNLPTTAVAGSVESVWVRVRNESDRPWLRHEAQGCRDDLVVWVDGAVSATHHLPCASLAPGAECTFHFALRTPTRPGRHRVVVDMVRQNIARFSPRGAARLSHALDVLPGAAERTDQLQRRADSLCPWYYQPSGGLARGLDGARYPVFVEEARGCHVRDVQGRRCLDYVMGWGSALLGYADPRVQAAVAGVLGSGAILPLPHPYEVEVAELLREAIPCAERVAYGKHGSDVCTLAARLARAFTGRRTILFSGYHGWHDWWVEQLGFAASGVPERAEPLLHRFRMNDIAHFEELFARHRGDLAAVFVEPAGAAEGEQGHSQDADAAFLRALARRAREAGALLVFDEVLTGFRYRQGSVQRATGVIPDLCCLGKALGGGLPLSALAGRAAVMERAIEHTHYGPTARAEVYSLAAARAALAIYRDEPPAPHVWRHGEQLRAGIDALCRQTGVAARCTGPAFRMTLCFDEEDAELRRLMRTYYFQEMLRGGVITYHGFMLPSVAHDDAALAWLLEAAGPALDRVAAARRTGTLPGRVEIPLL